MVNLDAGHYKKKKDKKEIRQCLSCLQEFKSTHKFNRICLKCKKNINAMLDDQKFTISV